MATIFRNPKIADCFVEATGVRADSAPESIAPITEPYEEGKLITFPDLKFDIDFDFWASLSTDDYPGLKKLSSSAGMDDPRNDPRLDRSFNEAGLPPAMEDRLREEMKRLSDQVLPVYQRIFGDYVFTTRQVVWRLNTIRNENMHVDTYKVPFKEHFARLFINLDNQPRIWQASHDIRES